MSADQSASGCDVLIVGAGPTGLTAACDLARRGLRVRIIEQNTGPAEHSRALAVQARTMEILAQLGVIERILAAGIPIRAANFLSTERPLGRLEMPALPTPYPFILSIPQSETERLLGAHLAELGVPIQWNTRFEQLKLHDGHVTGSLRAADGSERGFDVPWLLGCDGAHSSVRRQLGLTFEGERYPEWFALADVRIHWERAHNEAYIFLAPRAPLAIFPLPPAEYYRIICPLPDHDPDQEPQLKFEDFERMMTERSGTPTRISDPVWISTFRIHRRIVSRYCQGRVFLAGDAAHVHSPVGGQGMNTGIQDATNLTWKLALVHQGAARETLLDTYHQERHPVGLAILRGTDWATRLVTMQNSLAQQVRDTVFELIVNLDFAKRRITRTVSMIGHNYRYSPAVAEHHESLADVLARRNAGGDGLTLTAWHDFSRGPRAGDRSPDADVALAGDARVRRLFMLFERPRHVLLWFEGIQSRDGADERLRVVADRLRSRYARLLDGFVVTVRDERKPIDDWSIVIDAAQAAHRAYGAEQECLYLVRPDGHIGLRSQPADVEALLAYLARWFT